MTYFDEYKKKLFLNDDSKTRLIDSIRDAGYSATDFDDAYSKLFLKVEPLHFQKILAPFLRACAIDHLRNGNTVLTLGFRAEFENAMGRLDIHESGDVSTLSGFFAQQSQAYVYATGIEATALAEYLNVSFAATRVDNRLNSTSEPIYFYYRASPSSAPTVHLFNKMNDHFFIHEGQYGSTLADGNCLYNGFAQVLQQYIIQEQNNEVIICQSQQAIIDKLQSMQPMPIAELMKNAIAKRTPMEETDRQLALQYAEKEIASSISLPPASSNSKPLLEIYHKEEELFAPDLTKFKKQIDLMSEKGRKFHKAYENTPKRLLSLFNINYEEAAKEATALANTLQLKLDAYNTNPEKDPLSFRNDCMNEINNSKSVLEKHRGFKELLINLVAALFSFGGSLLYNKGFFPIKTNSSIILDDMEAILSDSAPKHQTNNSSI